MVGETLRRRCGIGPTIAVTPSRWKPTGGSAVSGNDTRRTGESNRRPRLRDLGAEPGVLPTGEANALTDVPGVSVGHVTLDEGDPADPPCLRTGVTAIRPADRDLYDEPVAGATHVINGYGKAVGLPQVDELGAIETPILLTNTLNTWRVADALVGRILDRQQDARSINPLVAECNDGRLNDIRGRHLGREHVDTALDGATTPNTAEGCVGAGTGMVGFGWKGGVGTASRVVDIDGDDCTVGALTLTNTGRPGDLRLDGVRVGRHVEPDDPRAEETRPDGSDDATGSDDGSIVIVVGTDAPVSGRQLSRIAKRGTLGLGRTGATASHGSGDFVIAFGNADGTGRERSPSSTADAALSQVFRATAEAVEEAIGNSLVRATTTTGVGGTTYRAIPTAELRSLFQ